MYRGSQVTLAFYAAICMVVLMAALASQAEGCDWACQMKKQRQLQEQAEEGPAHETKRIPRGLKVILSPESTDPEADKKAQRFSGLRNQIQAEQRRKKERLLADIRRQAQEQNPASDNEILSQEEIANRAQRNQLIVDGHDPLGTGVGSIHILEPGHHESVDNYCVNGRCGDMTSRWRENDQGSYPVELYRGRPIPRSIEEMEELRRYELDDGRTPGTVTSGGGGSWDPVVQ